MYHSDWTREDGFEESVIYLFESDSTTPVMKARAVLNGEGTYNAIVRDYKSGRMVGSDTAPMKIGGAKKRALEICRQLFKLGSLEN